MTVAISRIIIWIDYIKCIFRAQGILRPVNPLATDIYFTVIEAEGSKGFVRIASEKR